MLMCAKIIDFVQNGENTQDSIIIATKILSGKVNDFKTCIWES